MSRSSQPAHAATAAISIVNFVTCAAYELLFVEDHPEAVARCGIRRSPNLVEVFSTCHGERPE